MNEIREEVGTTAQGGIEVNRHGVLFSGDLFDDWDDLVFDDFGVDIVIDSVSRDREAENDARVRGEVGEHVDHVSKVTRELIFVSPVLWFGIVSAQLDGD